LCHESADDSNRQQSVGASITYLASNVLAVMPGDTLLQA